MTDPRSKFWFDIIQAIDAVMEFTAGMETLIAYVADRKTKSAVERQLAIIGEAVRHLQRLDPALALPEAGQIVGMRNRLIHSYDNVSDKLVWQVVRVDLPKLKAIALIHIPPL